LADFGSCFGQSWARDRYERPRLEKCCINQRKLYRETDPKAPKLKSKICQQVRPSLCYAIELPGRKSAFRAGFWKAPKSALRPAFGRPEADFGAFPVAVRPKSGPEGRFTARKHRLQDRAGREGDKAENQRKTTNKNRKNTETQGPWPGLSGFCISALTVQPRFSPTVPRRTSPPTCIGQNRRLSPPRCVGQTGTGPKYSTRGCTLDGYKIL
jgi:hypothetical protein